MTRADDYQRPLLLQPAPPFQLLILPYQRLPASLLACQHYPSLASLPHHHYSSLAFLCGGCGA